MTVISLLTTIALGLVVFARIGPHLGVWDDLAFLTSAIVFLFGLVSLLGARASESADRHRLEGADEDQRTAGLRRD